MKLWCTITLIPALALTGTRTNVVVIGDGQRHSYASVVAYDALGVRTQPHRRGLPARGRTFRLRLPPGAVRVYGTVEREDAACGDHLDLVVP